MGEILSKKFPNVFQHVEENGGRGAMPVMVSHGDGFQALRVYLAAKCAAAQGLPVHQVDTPLRVYSPGGPLEVGDHAGSFVIDKAGTENRCFYLRGYLVVEDSLFWAYLEFPGSDWHGWPMIIHPVDPVRDREALTAVLGPVPSPLAPCEVSGSSSG